MSRAQPEHYEQAMLFKWIGLARHRVPDLALLFAIPNAGGFSGGFRANVARVAKLKREGVQSGVPDLCLPVSRGMYHALYIEMKAGKNKPTAAQIEWHELLRSRGNAVRVCYDWEAAKMAIETYLDAGIT